MNQHEKLTGMRFEEVLPHLRDGGRARRRYWNNSDIHGSYVQLVRFPVTGIHPQLMCWNEQDQEFYIWGGINRDVLETDWELCNP